MLILVKVSVIKIICVCLHFIYLGLISKLFDNPALVNPWAVLSSDIFGENLQAMEEDFPPPHSVTPPGFITALGFLQNFKYGTWWQFLPSPLFLRN